MDDRAQLMLIGAVVIAVAMLALVTVLNSTIYAQNVAPGNTLDETRETNEHLRVVERDVTRITERLQEKDGYVDEAKLNESLQVYASHRTEQTAWRSPAHVDARLNDTSKASTTVLRQEWDRKLYPNDSNTNDWKLVDDGTLTGGTPFEVVVELQDSGQGPTFVINRSGGQAARIEIDSNDNEVEFSSDPWCDEELPYSDDTVRINVTAGIAEGNSVGCWALPPAPYDVEIKGAHHVENGSYTITVAETDAPVDSNFAENRSAGNPYMTMPVDTATIDVTYGTGSVSMDTQVEVSPE